VICLGGNIRKACYGRKRFDLVGLDVFGAAGVVMCWTDVWSCRSFLYQPLRLQAWYDNASLDNQHQHLSDLPVRRLGVFVWEAQQQGLCAW